MSRQKKVSRPKVELDYWRCAYCVAIARRFIKEHNILSVDEIGGIPRENMNKLVAEIIERVGYADQFELVE